MQICVALVGLAAFVTTALALPTPLEEHFNDEYRGEKYSDPQAGNDIDDNEVRELDAIGGSNLLRNLDSLGGGHLLRQTRRPGLDSLSGGGFGVSKRADSLSGQSFGTQKRNFDEIDRNGFSGFVKKNFDEIDRNGFDTFVKRNFDEIDRVGFSSFLKRSIPELLQRYYKHKTRQ